ncbi:MAG: hypothetical protein R2693_03170 [Nocardioidaceae bacterium]
MGAALVATTAAPQGAQDLDKRIPDSLGTMVAPRLIKAPGHAPDLVDSARKSGSNIGYIVSGISSAMETSPTRRRSSS